MWYKINTFEELEKGVEEGLMSRVNSMVKVEKPSDWTYEPGIMYTQSAARTINMSGRTLMMYLRASKIELRKKPNIRVVQVDSSHVIDHRWSINNLVIYGVPDIYVFEFKNLERYDSHKHIIEDYAQWKTTLVLCKEFPDNIFKNNTGLFYDKKELKKFINNY
jgi:hypothetical protein